MIDVEIQTGTNQYFFKTQETVMKCPICKREYKNKKICLNGNKTKHPKTPTFKHIKEHVGSILKDLTKYNCDCIFGSWFRWGAHWTENYPKTRCRHAKWAHKKIMFTIHEAKENLTSK